MTKVHLWKSWECCEGSKSVSVVKQRGNTVPALYLWVSPQRNTMLATNKRHGADQDPHLVHNISLSETELTLMGAGTDLKEQALCFPLRYWQDINVTIQTCVEI